jgi:phage portal protein BeeE
MTKIKTFEFALENTGRFNEKIIRNQPFVSWGVDNMEIERWYDYADFSPIHSACIRSKVDNASGKGFIRDYKINTKETLNDVVQQIFWEFVVGGNVFLEIVWKTDRREGISGFHVIPSKFMRAGAPKTDELYSDTWYYSHDWANWKRSGIVEFKEFDPENYTDRQIIHIKAYQPGYLFYGVPAYLSSMLDIRLSRAISEFNLSNISNGASPSLWVHFPQEAPDSQNDQEEILERLEGRYRGSANAGRIVVSYGGESGRPEITQITPTMQTGGYAEIFALVRENILAGHKIVDGSIIGLPSPTGFNSSADQLETTYKLFMNTSVKPMQEFIIKELEPIVQLMYPNEPVELSIQQNQSIL